MAQYDLQGIDDTETPTEQGAPTEEVDTTPENYTPGDDIPVAKDDSLTVIDFIQQCFDEAEDAQRDRMWMNEMNWDVYHGRARTEGKVEGQSNECLPKLASALEQIAATIKKGLVTFSNYFDVTLTPDPQITGSPLTASGVVKLMRRRLEDPDELVKGVTDFPTTIEDGIKSAALNSLFVLKVHGCWDTCQKYDVEVTNIHQTYKDDVTGVQYADAKASHRKEDLVLIETKVWKLVIELVNPKDFFQDPTGRELFCIHRTWRDLYEVVDEANSGYYDKEAVLELARSCADYSDPQQEGELERQTNQPISMRPTFRKRVELREYWGHILDSDGNMIHRNCRAVVANRNYLIVKPEANPYAHGEKPFVVSPLLRVPFSTTHKALFDQAVQFILIMNEAYNLVVDGALGASWGINLVKAGAIKNLHEYKGGIPPGSTLIVDDGVQLNDVFASIKTGEVSQETMNLLNFTQQQFQESIFAPQTSLPTKTTSATATNSVNQGSDNIFSGVIFDLEANIIRPTLRLAWLTMLQNVDNWYASDIEGCIGKKAAMMLATMSPAMRFAKYGMGAKFKVNGLSSMLARSQEYQKLVVLQQALMQSPMLAQAFMQKYSPEKLLQHFLKVTMIDPDDFVMTEEEKATVDQRMQQMQMMSQMMGGGQGAFQQQGLPNQQQGNPVSQQQAQIASQNQPPQHF